MKYCLKIIHVAIKFHRDILMCYLVMGCTKIVLKLSKVSNYKNNQRGATIFV